MKYLIIPSATFVPQEMGQLYQMPMALLPINGEPIIDLIIKQYQNNYNIVVSAYNGYEMLEQNINNRHNCRTIKVDALKDVGYTIYNTFEKLVLKDEDSVVINFADTVIDNNDLTENCIVCKKTKTADKKWTYLDIKKGVIKQIFDKRVDDIKNYDNLALVCGVFAIKQANAFLQCMRDNVTDDGCDFYKSLKDYSNKCPFDYIEAQNWLDIGHPEEYFNSKIAIKSRQFNHMTFDKNRGIIKKYSDDKNKLISEIGWFLKLPKNLQYVAPRIFDYSLDLENPFVEMEYYSYPTLLELYLYGNLDEHSWKKIFNRICFVLNDFKNYKNTAPEIAIAAKRMYIDKTIERINKIKTDKEFSAYFEKPIVINGVKYKSLNEVVDLIPKVVSENLLDIKEFNIVHGDLCFANVLIDEKLNFLKLIDPRGSFGTFDIYGDQRYELAKIFHSFDGKYDYIIKDLFTINAVDNNIDYKFNESKIDLYKLAIEAFAQIPGFKLKEIELIESLLFLSMIPLHKENVNHQRMMLAVGLEIMNRWIDIKE